jgi:DNA-binding CsgD family transcriptional regulator
MTRALTPQQIIEVVEAHAAGESSNSIAKRYGCSGSTVLAHSQAARNGKRRAKRQVEAECEACGVTFSRTAGGDGRRFCTDQCKTETRARQAAEDAALLVAELAWIAGTDSWDNITRRLGYKSRETLSRHLMRIGENEWASKLARVDMTVPRDRAA